VDVRREPSGSGLWSGAIIAVAWLAKAWLGARIADNCENAAAWHYLCADVHPWAEVLQRTRSGQVPYVDFPREYPVGIGTLFWGLGRLFGAHGFADVLRLHVALALACDLICAALLYVAARTHGRTIATGVAVAALWWPSALVLSPFRYESVVGVTLLGGYLAYRRGAWAWSAGIWSLGIALKWYPAIALAIQELRAISEPGYFRRRLPRVLLAAGAVQLAVNGPYLVAALVAHGNVDAWLATYSFHAQRPLSPDTILGVLSLWLGPIPVERHAAWVSGALALIVLATRRTMALEPKFVLTCIALLLVNRVYSPQFDLWFMPFLLLTLAAQSGARRWLLALPAVVVDLATVALFPFLYAGVVNEFGGGFAPGGMAAHGGPFSELFTSAVILRAFGLLALAAGLYRTHGDVPRSEHG
jgi:hypothetical protein